MKKLLLFISLFICNYVNAQELYVFTEPASNMPANSIAVRLNTKLSRMNHTNQWSMWRVNPEVMIGVNRKWMLHLNGFMSETFQDKMRFEGAGIYAKYRVHSSDDIHRHFRIAAYGKVSIVKNPVFIHANNHHIRNFEIDTDGEVSGLGGGVIATKLNNRLALSSTLGYVYRLNNISYVKESLQPWHGMNWSASAGYLLLPKEYTDYRQTNMNVYFEVLGYNSLDAEGYYIDAAPAIQFIFNSVARLDLGYRTQLTGRGERFNNSSFVMKLEYDFLNVFHKRD